MKLHEILNEAMEHDQQLFLVRCRGNFYGGKYYETGLDSVFVLASSPDEAVNIANNNIDAIIEHFKNKRVHGGKPGMRRKDNTGVKIVDAKQTSQSSHSKVLTSNGYIEPVNLNEDADSTKAIKELSKHKKKYRSGGNSEGDAKQRRKTRIQDRMANKADDPLFK